MEVWDKLDEVIGAGFLTAGGCVFVAFGACGNSGRMRGRDNFAVDRKGK